ncbi:MAG: hypothetical protein E7241_06025 [Lachnospiraceae bacterium]|jgi:flagellar protein FlgJ|nr:hypothetical protein [Lachnospiraceae bacterium]
MAISMDGLTSQLYSQISNQQVNDTASKIREGSGKDYSKASDEELMDVCKEFESYFLEQLFKNMEKMVPKSQFESGYASAMTDYYKDELIRNYSADAVKNGQGLGLAQKLYEQMKRNYDL